MRTRTALLLGLLLPPLAGCLRVEVSRTNDPGPAFAVARREAMRFQGRQGPARELGAVIWSADEKRLIRARVPMWLVRKFDRGPLREPARGGSGARESRLRRSPQPTGDGLRPASQPDGDGLGERLSRRLSVRDLDRAGLGLLFELDEEQGERVLVWLQ